MTNNLKRAHDLLSTPPASSHVLTAVEFHQLAQVPPAAEWFDNIDRPNTRRDYRSWFTRENRGKCNRSLRSLPAPVIKARLASQRML